MRTVAMLCSDEVHIQRVTTALQRKAEIKTFSSIRALVSTLHASSSTTVIADLYRPNGEPITTVVEQLRTAFPLVAVLVYMSTISVIEVSLLVDILHGGVSDIIMQGVNDSPVKLLQLMELIPPYNAIVLLNRELEKIPSAYVQAFCRYAFTNGSRRMNVKEVCRYLHVTRQHMAREFHALGLRRPEWFIHAARLLQAAWLLQRSTYSVDRIAYTLKFSAGSAIRRTLGHDFGITIADLRQDGGFEHFLHQVRLALQPQFSPTIV